MAASITIDVVGDGNAILEHAPGVRGPWRPVCVSPCAVRAPSDGLYRVDGPGSPSRPLRLTPASNGVVLQARPGEPSGGLLALGVLGSVATGSAIVMSTVALAGASLFCFSCAPASAPSWVAPLAVSALVVGVVGAIALVVGFVEYREHHRAGLRQLHLTAPVSQQSPLSIRF